MRLLIIGIVVYGLALYPAILRSTKEKGYDAPIYWHAARGELVVVDPPHGPRHIGWVYSDRLLAPLRCLGGLGYPTFLALLHIANVLGIARVAASASSLSCRGLAWGVVVVIGAKTSDILAGGNCTGLLCGLSLSPWGALLACAVKPHYSVALVLHAVLFATRGMAVGNRPLRQLPLASANPRVGAEEQ